MEENLPSLENLIDKFQSLPGIGRKTAQRLAFRVLDFSDEKAYAFADAVIQAKRNIRECSCCFNLSENELCGICSDKNRDREYICVVEDVKSLISLEKVREYHGLYHVLHGVLSPRDGITPDKLHIRELVYRVQDPDNKVEEVIIATSPTVEGDTTALYISKLLKPYNVKITRLAYGIPVGGDLEFADEGTLFRAFKGRTEIE